MEILIIMALVVLAIWTVILPWINRSNINDLKMEIRHLERIIDNLHAPDKAKPAQAKKIFLEPKEQHIEDIPPPPKAKAQSLSIKKESKISFEQQFAARMPVWIGGIALALAGFFMVKYSIDNNLLSPAVRVTLGGMLGLGLLYSAKWVRNRPDFANGVRIAQSLAGAGIAVLYVVSFASARLYHLIPLYGAFVAMAGVTATALVLALRHGPPIALLGMAGGFLTPALLSTGGGDALFLFVYLYFTASGLLIVVRKTKLWWLSIPTIILSLLWVFVWLFSSYTAGDSIYLGLFLTGIAATIVINSRQQYEMDGGGTYAGIFKLTSILNYIGLGGTLMMMGLIAGKAGFGFMEWGLFGLLSAGGIGLAYFNSKLYGFIPLLSMAVNIVMLFVWNSQDPLLFAQTLGIFATLFVAGGYLLMFKSERPILWGGLAGSSSIAYYLLAYYKLHQTALFFSIPLFWGLLALALAAAATYALFKIYDNLRGYPYREHLYAVFTITATAFVSLGLSIELEREFLSVAIAGEMLAICWLNNIVSIKALRPIIAVVACMFALLLMPQIILMIQLTLYSLIEAKLRLQSSIPIINWPLFQLGVPALMFLGGSYLLRKQEDNRLVRVFEVAAIVLVAVMGYYLTRNILHPNENVMFIKVGFFERGVITNVLFVFGLACLFSGRKFQRIALSYSGILLCAVALFRIAYFDMLIYNPLWHKQEITGYTLFNSLLLPYGLPIVWSYLARSEIQIMGKRKLSAYLGGFMLALVFALISMNVRHIFHGHYLHTGLTTNAEIYSYSAAWLLLGIALLFGGIVKQDKMLRYASLSIILFTVGKVFLYDASELEGLYRVFSFFGLGLSLIGLSYFYTKFVFKDDT